MSEPSDVEPAVPAPPPAQTPGPDHHEVTVDLAAFLPEGTELAAQPPDPWDTDAPEPEVPAWARDDAPPVPEPAAAPVDDALARIDGELAAVDDALVALDAGHPERSPLLQELLGP